jgi:hypothetical protein
LVNGQRGDAVEGSVISHFISLLDKVNIMLNIILSIIGTVLQSRYGQIATAALVAWLWGIHTTTVKYEARIAAEKASVEAAYKTELQRQEFATREIAEAATRRAQDDADTVRDMQAVIADYDAKLKETSDVKTQTNSCDIDDDFIRGVSKLDHAASSHTRIARRPGSIRKAR